MIKTMSIHDSTTSANPISDGVLKTVITATELSTVSGNSVIWTIVTPSVDMIIQDVWVDVITAVNLSSCKISAGDAAGDDSFLLPLEVGAAASTGRLGLLDTDKGQKLSDHQTALVTTELTVSLTASGSLATATGEVHVFVKFCEVNRDTFAASTFSTTAGTAAGTLGASTAPGNLAISDGTNSDTLGASDTLKIEDDNSTTTVVLNASTNTFTVSALPTTWSVTDGTTTETMTSGSALTFAAGANTTIGLSSGVVSIAASTGSWIASDLTTTKTVANGDTFQITGDSSIGAVFDTNSTKLVLSRQPLTSQYIAMQTSGTGNNALDQDIKSYVPTDRALFDNYEIDVTTLSGTDYGAILRFPDPGDFAKGTVFTIKNVSYSENPPAGHTASADILQELKTVRLLPEADVSGWTGSTLINGYYLHTAISTFDGFLLPRGASVTLTRLDTGGTPSSGFATRLPVWAITAHFDPREYENGSHSAISTLIASV